MCMYCTYLLLLMYVHVIEKRLLLDLAGAGARTLYLAGTGAPGIYNLEVNRGLISLGNF